MKNKITRFLSASIITISVLCVIVFSFLAYYMNKQSTETINEVGTIYMTGMSERISIHFRTTIEMRLSQVESLVEVCPPKSHMGDEEKESLIYNAKSRDFDYLALCSLDGTFEMIKGAQVSVTNPEPFFPG